ncbi:FG-GAP repeat domain-containing protein [Streptomyces sp. NPDC101118]|uniref:FG-GAP repeat domain-containing protein n=1 Tax=Streptomyces sp. NPDC101118 TaxID=3366109 RepID=UPI003806E488
MSISRPTPISRPKRLARLAACTALALSAGTLGASPALAADKPSAPAGAAKSRPAMPWLGSAKSTYATTPAKSRMDYDRDGLPDLVWRHVSGTSQSFMTSSTSDTSERFTIDGDDVETVKDVIPVGNVRGTAAPEVLTLSFDGRLSLHPAGKSGAGAAIWSGYGWQIYNRVIAAGDLTKDGRMDVLARTPGGSLYLYKGNGATSGNPFGTRIHVGTGWGSYDQIIGTNDLDRDGIGDLLARTTAGDLWFYKGTGSSSTPFKARVKVGPGWGAYNQIVATDDLSGDGRADIMARTYAGSVYVYLSTGSGRFSTRHFWQSGWEDTEFFLGSGITANYGRHSLLARGTDGKIYQYLTKANGSFYEKDDTGFQIPTAKMTGAAGLDKVNWVSPVEITVGGLYVHRGNVSQLAAGIPGNAVNITGPGDLTGDGRGDLLNVTSTGYLDLYAGDGTGKAYKTAVRVGSGWGTYNKLVGGGDFTGDGRPDLIARTSGGTLYLYPGTGNASAPFGSRVTVGTGWNTYNQIASPGDLTGDGRADLVARDSGGNLYRYMATGKTGTSTFGARVLLGSGWNTFEGLY